jgi:hypothetical protein
MILEFSPSSVCDTTISRLLEERPMVMNRGYGG